MRPSLVTNHRVPLMIVILVSLASFLVGSTFTGGVICRCWSSPIARSCGGY